MIEKGVNYYVHAHISNISFPKSIVELETFMLENGCYNVEDIINESNSGKVIWTVPRYSCKGDIVLFYHAKTAIQCIRKLETELKCLSNKKSTKTEIKDWLDRAINLYEKYGGKIFAIGKVVSTPEYENTDKIYHWSGRIYANISNILLLENPIDILEFKNFLLISRQSAITYLPSNEYKQLKELIIDKNDKLPIWFEKSEIYDKKLADINSDNYLQINMDYRRKYLFEIEFRSYYVDYLLKDMTKGKVWRECSCCNDGNIYYIDNCVMIKDIIVLIEVKLNINIEKNISIQLNHYLNSDHIIVNNKKIINFEKRYILVIDIYKLYKYDGLTNKIEVLACLDEIKDKEDVRNILCSLD